VATTEGGVPEKQRLQRKKRSNRGKSRVKAEGGKKRTWAKESLKRIQLKLARVED